MFEEKKRNSSLDIAHPEYHENEHDHDQKEKLETSIFFFFYFRSNALISLLNASLCGGFPPSFKTDCEVSRPKSPASLQKIPPVNMLQKRDFRQI